uniref:Uncharacterized protein n=1 Tax=Aegilops tauschii subsp. strangulata TaxID=200361 RepID=A0A453T7G0_AEGTS
MAQQDQDVIMYYRNGLLLAAALLVPLLLLVRLRRPRGENLPPGPWRLPVIGSLHHLVGRLPHRFMRDLARRYDAPLILLRLGELDVVVASSADAAREVLKTQDAVFATRMQTPTIRALTVDGAGIALAPHGEHWRQARKLGVTELLGARPVQSLRGSREAGVAALVASIASASAASGPVNVSSLLSTYIIDVAVRALVGDRIGGDLRGEFLERLGEGVRLATGFGLADLFPSSRLVRAFSGSLGRLEALGRETSRVMDRIIDKHQHAGDEEKDFVDVMLRIQKNDGSLRAGTIRAMITVRPVRGSERHLGDDARVGDGRAHGEPGGASEGAGGGAIRPGRGEPRPRGGPAGPALPASRAQGDAPAAPGGAAAAPAGVPRVPTCPRLHRAQGRHGARQRVGHRPGRGDLGRRRRGVQAGEVRRGGGAGLQGNQLQVRAVRRRPEDVPWDRLWPCGRGARTGQLPLPFRLGAPRRWAAHGGAARGHGQEEGRPLAACHSSGACACT